MSGTYFPNEAATALTVGDGTADPYILMILDTTKLVKVVSILGNHYDNANDDMFADLEVRVLEDADYSAVDGSIIDATGTVCDNSAPSLTAAGGDIICNTEGSAVLITKATGAADR